MFERQNVMFLYSLSPIHAGAGTAVGELIDNPIQRERHTRHPLIAGSGIKGAVRSAMREHLSSGDIDRIFGPPGDAEARHAGAVSFADAQIVLFPVRCLQRGFVWLASPVTLARLQRMLRLAGCDPQWSVPQPDSEETAVATDATQETLLTVDAFDFAVTKSSQMSAIAEDLAGWLMPDETDAVFARHLRESLLLVRESMFVHFVEQATIIEPHVRINDDTGTADDGGLFYTENVPPESVLVSLMLVSRERAAGQRREADQVAKILAERLHDGVVQFGGNATTGRGLMRVRLVEGRR